VRIKLNLISLSHLHCTHLHILGPALGIGRGCDGLGTMLLGGPNFFIEGGVYRNIWFYGGFILYITMLLKGPKY